MNDQDAPGAAPATPIKVFISYKTREHARYVDEISAVLRAAGFDIRYDEERKVPSLRTFGLDISLQRGLDESDAMLVLLPREPAPEPTTWQQLKDNADTWINFGYFAIGGIGYGLRLVMTIYWNKFWYGTDLAKSNKESWQDWERRIGQDFGHRGGAPGRDGVAGPGAASV